MLCLKNILHSIVVYISLFFEKSLAYLFRNCKTKEYLYSNPMIDDKERKNYVTKS